MACREYTLRDDPASEAKGWTQGNMRIGPVPEVATSFQNYKYGIDSRIESVGQDNSHSWDRISHGSYKTVIDSNSNNTEVLANPPEEQTSQSSAKVVAARSKAKAKPKKRETVELLSTILMNVRMWIDIEPAEFSLSLRTRPRRKPSNPPDTAKQYNEKKMEQFNSGESSSKSISTNLLLVG